MNPDLYAIKAAIRPVAEAFSNWFESAERIESGTAYDDIFDASGSDPDDAPPAYIQFRGGGYVEEWPEGSPGMDYPHYATIAERSSFVAYTLTEAAWWLWVNWSWQEGGDLSHAIYDAAFVPLGGGDAGS